MSDPWNGPGPNPSEPNTGRILDYWLGGKHHFPPDVAGAQAFQSLYPGYPEVFRVLREYIGRAVRFVRSQGVDQFLVFGSGIPTQGNVHEAVPDARVLYTDVDPVNVALGREILAGHPNAGYTFCDASDLSTLDRGEVERVLGPLRRVGFVLVGVSVFIADEPLRRTFENLYEWAPPGSWLVLDFDSELTREHPAVLAALAAIGAPFHMRSREAAASLLGRWRLTEEGIQPVAFWRNPEGDPDFPAFMYGGVAFRL